MTSPEENLEFEALLEFVKRNRGFDFTGYKRASLIRRFDRRMQMVNIKTYIHYIEYLEAHPEEFNHLFNTLLINVTSFFRDRSAWDYISSEIIPQIADRKAPGESIRIWSAGCASGEEAYTIAIMIAEVIGMEQFCDRIKIYATDVDEEALTVARQATYSIEDLTGLLPQQIEQFFEQTENSYTFRKDLRRSVIFGRHDLIQDAPISKIDLLICRNTIMYFNAETQTRILSRFHFALQEGGFLFLGKAEMLLSHADTFTPIDLKHRLFSKVPKLNLRNRLLSLMPAGTQEAGNHLSNHVRLREAAFDSGPSARVVIDVNGLLILANERARNLFNLTSRNLGRPLQDLELSYRPVELRSRIEQAYSEQRPVYVQDVAWQNAPGELLYLDVYVTPLLSMNNTILGISINFMDTTRCKRLQEELEHSNQELEMAYEELQSTNEELETTNEELQSSNEELETTNEELQSTNEELETMNEELQATNEELQTLNDEFQRHSEALNQSNTFLEAILRSLKGSVIVVDRDLYVQVWNHKAEDLWGVRTEEAVGQHMLNLDIGLPVEQLRQPLQSGLSGEPNSSSEIVVDAINRRGRSIQCHITCTPLVGGQGEIQGMILLMEEQNEEL